MAFMSPEEEKKYIKERLSYIKQAEKALKNEDLDAVIENFRKIVNVSTKLNDSRMVEEFTSKLRVLTQGIDESDIAVEYQKTQMTISDFINELAEAPKRIIKGTTTQIPVDLTPGIAVPTSETREIFDELEITKVPIEEEIDIEEEIQRRGTLDQQLNDLKKILNYKKKDQQ
ncbi:MAG: hypothetical protein ACTSRW_10540 [Candidatus Helarchaeota archaeon]